MIGSDENLIRFELRSENSILLSLMTAAAAAVACFLIRFRVLRRRHGYDDN